MTEVQPGWGCKVLMDLAEYHNGAAFKPKDWVDDGLPIIRIEQISRPDSDSDKFDGFVDPSNLIDTGDLIFSWSATLKVIIWKGGPAVLNQHLYKVVPNENTEKGYLLQLLDHNMEKLAARSQGSTMKHVTRRELTKFRVCLPKDSNHQKKIAAILETVDEAIERTEALIGKYKQIKAGMMQDLFTRGLTSDGKLRPTRQQAPDLYQETPIGWIPKNWQIQSLHELTTKIVDGIHHRPNYVESGIPFVTVKNLTQSDTIDFSSTNFIDSKTHAQCKARANAEPGDVLVTKDGTLGVSRIVESWMPDFSIFVSVALLKPISKLTSEWLHLFFESGTYLKQLAGLSAGSGLQHIHLEHFRKFIIPLPCLDEQSAIAGKIESAQTVVKKEKKKLQKLRQQKSGLMHDLLTGKVPVKV